MRIGLAQLNPTVGDLAGNRHLILEAYHALVVAGAELVVFPELVVTGYPPRDLLFKKRFGEDADASLAEIAAATGPVPALIATTETTPAPKGRPFFNTAALCHDGTVQGFARKCLLPTYDVFDEDRYFEPASVPATIFKLQGHRIGVTICEDIWTLPRVTPRNRHHLNPLAWLAGQKLDLMVNLSASPWHLGKGDARNALVTDAALALDCPIVYVNAVGGIDELVFDGRSLTSDARGNLTSGLGAFAPAPPKS